VNVVQANVSFPTFDAADVGPVESGLVGEGLLAETSGLPQRPNPLTERNAAFVKRGRWGDHLATVGV
jgi:hypothetical protein